MDKNTISILTNNYNGSSYFSKFFKSLYSQSYENWKLVFYDNCSSDNSLNLIKKYYQDKRIFVYKSPKHLPLGEVRQLALSKCDTSLTSIWDVDDLSYSNRLSLQKEYLDNNPNISLVTCNVKKFDIKNNKLIKNYITPKDNTDLKNKCVWSNPIVHSSIMFKTDVIKNIGGYDINYNYSQDYNLYIRLILDNQIFANIDKYLTIQNFTDQTLSSKKEMQIIIYKDQIKNLREAFKIKNINFIFKLLNIFSQIFYICKIYVYNLRMKLKKN
jgi:glycosyltransferase involved in cell wall biosynthesis